MKGISVIMDKNKEPLHDGWDEYATKRIYRNPGKVNFWHSLGFGTFSAFSAAMQGLITAWLLFFFTTFCGLTAAQGASIFLIGRIADAVASLLMGNLSDKFYKYRLGRRFGRRHFFILIAAPISLIPISIWITGMHYWYYLSTYLITTIMMSVLQIPWETLPNEMTKDYNQRTTMSTVRMTLAGLYGMIGSLVIAQVFKLMPNTSSKPYIIAQVVLSAFSFLMVLITYFSTWEHFITKKEALELEQTDTDDQKHINIKAELRNYFSTFKIKSFRKHMGIYLCSFLGASVFSTVFVYLIVDVLGLTTATTSYLQSFAIISVPVTILSGYLITKITPRTLLILCYTMSIITAFLWTYIALVRPSHIMIWVIVTTIIWYIAVYILWFVPWNVFPFIPDLDTLVTGQNRSGLFASVMVFINQVAMGFSSVIIGYMLDWSGLITSTKGIVHQPQSAQNMILALVWIGAGVLVFLALLFASRFHVNRKTIKVVNDEIMRLRAGGKMGDVDPQVKATCEDLTGIKYDSITVWKEIQTAKEQLNIDKH